MSFDGLFHPRGIAIVGASADLTRIGGQPIQALRDAGYRGRVYPVNPKYDAIAGFPCVASVHDIDGPCDLAVIVLKAEMVLDAVRACGSKSIRNAIILSGGFREIGVEGAELERELVNAARESGVRVIGPNCQGMIALHDRVFAVFGAPAGDVNLPEGNVSMCFQSGGVGFATLAMCVAQGAGIRHCISTGNEADVTTPELLDALLDDEQTSIVFNYIEGTPNGRALVEAAKKGLRLSKPILVWKGGRTDVGAEAAASHTAQLTGSYDVFQAACRQFGMLEVKDAEEVADFVKAFTPGRLPAGGNIGAVSISGGMGIVFADAAIEHGLSLPKYRSDTLARLSQIIPSFGSAANPADVTASVFNDPKIFTEAINAVVADPDIHQVCLLLASIPDPLASKVATAIVEASRHTDKPVMVGWSIRRDRAEQAYRIFEEAGIPVFANPTRLARAASALFRYGSAKAAYSANATSGHEEKRPEMPAKSGILDEAESKQLLKSFGVPIAREVFIPTGSDVSTAIAGLAYPLVVKIVSPDISHKTEAGGVKLNLPDEAAVMEAIETVRANARSYDAAAELTGVLVGEMVSDGLETIVGIVNDKTFGPVVAMGMGGILTEVLRDVTYRLAPIEIDEAQAMIGELRGKALFNGVRGKPPLDVKALASTISAISKMAWHGRDRIEEIDVNPVLVRPSGKGVVAADGLIVLN